MIKLVLILCLIIILSHGTELNVTIDCIKEYIESFKSKMVHIL